MGKRKSVHERTREGQAPQSASVSPAWAYLPTSCQACGATLTGAKKFCVVCGAPAKRYASADQESPKVQHERRWHAAWEPPPIGRLIPPPPPPVGRIFRLVVTAPNLKRFTDISAAGRWGRALLTLGAGLFILPLFDWRFLGTSQAGIGFLIGTLGILFMIGGSRRRRSSSHSLSAEITQGVNCPSCKNLNPALARFCRACGRALVGQAAILPPSASCQSCGKSMKPEAKFCTACGTRVAQSARRT
jgi:hypothetical protein